MLAKLILLLAVLPLAHASEGAGSVQTKYFDISIEPQKKVFAPGELLVAKITVTDKNTKKPVLGASVLAELSIYQGGDVEKIELPSESGVYLIEQKLLNKKIVAGAQEIGGGVYELVREVDTEAAWGGITLKLTVTKEGKSDTLTTVISFMEFTVWKYALLVTLAAIAIGSGVGFIFGGIKH